MNNSILCITVCMRKVPLWYVCEFRVKTYLATRKLSTWRDMDFLFPQLISFVWVQTGNTGVGRTGIPGINLMEAGLKGCGWYGQSRRAHACAVSSGGHTANNISDGHTCQCRFSRSLQGLLVLWCGRCLALFSASPLAHISPNLGRYITSKSGNLMNVL